MKTLAYLMLVLLITGCSQKSTGPEVTGAMTGSSYFSYSKNTTTGEEYYRLFDFNGGNLSIYSIYWPGYGPGYYAYRMNRTSPNNYGVTWSSSTDGSITHRYCSGEDRCVSNCSDSGCEEQKTATYTFKILSSGNVSVTYEGRTYELFNRLTNADPVMRSYYWDSAGSHVPSF